MVLDAYFIGMAIFGGILSFLAPCNLIAIPSFISYCTSESTSMKRGLFLSLTYGLGFCTMFTIVGIALVFVPGFIAQKVWLQVFGGIAIILMGGFLTVKYSRNRFKMNHKSTSKIAEPRQQEIASKASKTNDALSPTTSVLIQDLPSQKYASFSRIYVLGLSLGTSGVSCSLPIFLTIIIAIATSLTLGEGIIALLAYSFGIIIPFFIIGLAIGKFTEVMAIRLIKFAEHLRLIFGILLIVMGILFIRTGLLALGFF